MRFKHVQAIFCHVTVFFAWNSTGQCWCSRPPKVLVDWDPAIVWCKQTLSNFPPNEQVWTLHDVNGIVMYSHCTIYLSVSHPAFTGHLSFAHLRWFQYWRSPSGAPAWPPEAPRHFQADAQPRLQGRTSEPELAMRLEVEPLCITTWNEILWNRTFSWLFRCFTSVGHHIHNICFWSPPLTNI